MADNVTVTNKKTTFDADTNADLPIRTSETAGSTQIQHVRLDLGVGTAEAVAEGALPVSGTVTANAGTNLNTSALALESGGNLATIAGKDFATQTTLAALNAKVTAVDTGAVVVSSSVLPSGAATSAAQLPNSHDVTIDNAAGAAAVNIQDGGNIITVDGTVTANLGTIAGVATETTLSALNAKIPALGQAAMAASIPVTMASNQTNMPVNVVQQGGVAITLNTGVRDAGTQRVTIATNDTLATVTTVGTVTNITNQGQIVDNAGFTDGTTRLNMAGFIFDEVAGTALTENDGAASRIDSKRAMVFTLEDATTRGRRVTVSATGAVSVNETGNVTIGTGLTNVTTAGTRVALAGSTACRKVDICARSTNTGVIWVGGSTVAANSGIPLVALQRYDISISNLATVFIDSTVNGEGVTYTFYN